jgi:hypothetical protein
LRRTAVAPFTGAWIEMGRGAALANGAAVAPFTGAFPLLRGRRRPQHLFDIFRQIS